MERSKLAFILGTGRCGSTLLSELVAAHESVGFVTNYDDRLRLPLSWQARAVALYQQAPTALAERPRRFWVKPSEGYRALAREVSPMLVAPMRDLVAADATPWTTKRLRRFFERRMNAQGRQLFYHKFTGWPRARFLHHVFPDARFVHVVRDGRAVANSLLQQPWWPGYSGPDGWGWGPLPEPYRKSWLLADRSFVVLAAIEWMMLMDAFRDTAQEVPESQWLEVKYEDLLTDPRACLGRVLEFLGLPWKERFAARVARYRFRPGRVEAFRQDLAPRDVDLLDEVLASHLSRYGYSGGPAG